MQYLAATVSNIDLVNSGYPFSVFPIHCECAQGG